MMTIYLNTFLLLLLSLMYVIVCESIDGVVLPTRCETCKFVAIELEQKFAETGKIKQIIDVGGHIDRTKKVPYRHSELGFLESLESVCDNLLSYNMHKEHLDSKRFAKGRSETMRTLHNLKDKGVKVELGIPEHLWDEPSAEITRMKQECEQLIEEYEEDLEDWYSNENLRQQPLKSYLCKQRFLKGRDASCLKDGDKHEL